MNQQSKNTPQSFYLKPLTVKHIEVISGWYQNIDELALIESNLPLPINPQSLEKFWQRDLEQKEPRTSYVYSICNEEGLPVGLTGLQDINFTYGNGVVFIFVRKENRRHGLALRSIALMLDMAFDQLRLHRITTYVHSDNTPSMSLISRIGFTQEGQMREACFNNGQHSDVNIVSMLAREWQEYRKSLSEGLDSTTILSIGHDENTRWIWPLK
jgi:RimJ/RimL family protein N-acetyltransferase